MHSRIASLFRRLLRLRRRGELYQFDEFERPKKLRAEIDRFLKKGGMGVALSRVAGTPLEAQMVSHIQGLQKAVDGGRAEATEAARLAEHHEQWRAAGSGEE